MNILVDTNILIDYLRRDKKQEALFYRLFSTKDTSVISYVTIAELYAGKSVELKKEKNNVDRVIGGCKLMEISIGICKIAGEFIRIDQELQFQDAVIAATAVYHDLPLLTFNKKDFSKIKGITLYRH